MEEIYKERPEIQNIEGYDHPLNSTDANHKTSLPQL